MVKIKMEVYDSWIIIETVPITPKTFKELNTRVPDLITWRPVLLNKIIKFPQFSVKEWGNNVPVSIINDILLCIDDILSEYSKNEIRLNEMIENSLLEEDIDLDKYSEERDLLLQKLGEIENDYGCFEYNKEDLKKLRQQSREKPKPLYIG